MVRIAYARCMQYRSKNISRVGGLAFRYAQLQRYMLYYMQPSRALIIFLALVF